MSANIYIRIQPMKLKIHSGNTDPDESDHVFRQGKNEMDCWLQDLRLWLFINCS
jgi:hypothetical protein